MSQIAVVTFWILTFLTLGQAFCVALMVRLFHRARPADVSDEDCPRAAVLLPLRGADPTLADCLRRLCSQDYPDYEIRIVVDSENDPAGDTVEQVIDEMDVKNVRVSHLRGRSETCSLKCSALLQMVGELDESVEAIVLADADLEAPRTWLRELTAPLGDSRVGAAFGNRWFMPPVGRCGSLVRYLLNIVGIGPMCLFQIPWGGSLAIRAASFRKAAIDEQWSRSLVDDVPVGTALKALGLKIKFVPLLMMPNREECSLPHVWSFMPRQLLWTRLYSYGWWLLILLAVLLLAGMLGGTVLLVVAAAATGNWSAAVWAGAGLTFYVGAILAKIAVLEHGVRRIVRSNGEATGWMRSTTPVKLAVLLPLALCVYTAAALRATFTNRVQWRGVTYLIRAPEDIQIVDYRAFEPNKRMGEPRHSI